MDKQYVLGIDIGGTNTEFGVVDINGKIILRGKISTKKPTTGEDYDKVEEYLDVLVPSLKKLIEDSGGIDYFKGVGIGAPNGNFHTGKMEFAPNLKWAREDEIHLTKLIEGRLNPVTKTSVSNAPILPCVLTNDANAAAIGEMTYGVAKKRSFKHFVMITLGTGVGSGIVINGFVLYGHDGFAGELGHVIVRPYNGRMCGCGRCGCLETYASAPGIARTAREMLESGWDKAKGRKESLLRNVTNKDITSKDVSEAAEKGDDLAIEVYNVTGRILGEAFANFVTFSSPEAIILFGGPAKAGELIRKPIKESMTSNMLKVFKKRGTNECKTEILFSELPDADAAVLGAAALAWEIK